MPEPTLTVEIGFASDPGTALGSTVWTDITDYVTAVQVRRGRSRELDAFQAGSCRVELDDIDGRFNPSNTAGAYYPNVKPMRRLRVSATAFSLDGGSAASTGPAELSAGSASTSAFEATVDGGSASSSVVEKVLFCGFVDRWPQSWPQGSFGRVTVEATDGFKVLAGRGLPSSVYAWEVEQDGPAHWFRLGDPSGTVAVDSGTDPIDGAYVGSPTLAASSLAEHDSDTAVTFDGTDDEVQVANTAAVDPAGPWSIELLMRTDATPDPGGTSMWSQGSAAGSLFGSAVVRPGVLVGIRNDADPVPVLIIGDTTGTNTTRGTTDINDGVTHHIVATFDGTYLGMWVDGVDEGTLLTAVTVTPTSGPVYLGSAHGSLTSAGSPYDGVLDEVASYDLVLSDARIGVHAAAVDTPWNGDTSGQRIGKVLDLVDWPTADRDIDTGVTTFGDAAFGGMTALAYVQLCEQSENGHLFITRTGTVRFVGRHNILTEALYSTSQATFTDNPTAGQFGYVELEPDYDDDIANLVSVQRRNGRAIVAEDTDSQTAYLTRTLSRTGQLMTTDAEARSAAQWLLNRNKDPQVEVRRIVMHPYLDGDDDVWSQVLSRDLMERVTVVRDHPGGGDTFTQESHIQGVEWRIQTTPGRVTWECGWWLSPADAVDYLILDDATYGQLDSNALAY